MEVNEELRDHIFAIINNQLRDNDPPETKTTFNRLKELGHDEFETKQMIGQCLAVEIYNIMTHGKPFDEKRYIKNLTALPKEPIE